MGLFGRREQPKLQQNSTRENVTSWSPRVGGIFNQSIAGASEIRRRTGSVIGRGPTLVGVIGYHIDGLVVRNGRETRYIAFLRMNIRRTLHGQVEEVMRGIIIDEVGQPPEVQYAINFDSMLHPSSYVLATLSGIRGAS